MKVKRGAQLEKTTAIRCSGVARVARLVGCHPNHLSYIMHGHRQPNEALRRRLARLGITMTVDGKAFEEAR